jgi:glycine C-acetyltransferase
MSRANFTTVLQQELDRLDAAAISKRHERTIEDFTADPAPKGIINGKPYGIFNSNDYLGLRHHATLKSADHAASQKYGTGPGAVRFISGSLRVYTELEAAIAKFHGRQAGMLFSSAFAANLAVLFSFIKGQSKDSLVSGNTLVVSDELNHRSIIDGIRLGNLSSEQKAIFPHMQGDALRAVLQENLGKFDRVLVVTDGVFSMLGEIQNLAVLRKIVDEFDEQFPEGVWLIVDDCHGVAACGATGRGAEEVSGAQADILVGTFGKGFGADGGYIVADQVVIDSLRESSATYIYSNSVSPGTAGAALAAVQLVDSTEGKALVAKSQASVAWFKQAMQAAGFTFAADSQHPIQPLWIGDAAKAQALTKALFEQGYMVTSINYPVVAAGKDEIRIQISAAHTQEDLEAFVAACVSAGKSLGLVS